MKTKGLILSGVLVFIVSIASAQLKFGLKEGVNFSTQSDLGMLWDNNDIKTGYTIGVVVDYRFHPVISLQTEINYKNEGLAYERTEANSKKEYKRNYDYYNIPLLVKGRFSEQLGLTENWSVSFYGGPYYSYLRSADAEVKENGISTVSDFEDNSNKSDWGLIFGMETSRNFTVGELFFDLRYEMGLHDVTENEDIKNKVIGISIGYRF